MKQVSYSETETETVFCAGRDLEEARKAQESRQADNPRDAWDALPFWDRQDTPDEFEVFRIVTTTQITKVDPPYTRELK